MSAPRNLRVWVEFHLEDTAGSTTVYRWGNADLADPSTYEGGWKECRVVSVGAIDRAISDYSGEHSIATASVTLDDTDNFIRTLLDADATSYVDGRDVVLKAASDTQRAAAGTATVLMRGKARNLRLEDGLGAVMEIEEALGSSFGPANPDKPIQRLFRREIFPEIHRDLIGTPVPLILGECSDAGATDAEGNNAEKGVCPGIYVGRFQLASDGSVTPVTDVSTTTVLQPPSGLTITQAGTPGTREMRYSVSAYTENGETTPCDSVLTSTAPATLDATNYNTVSWTAPVGFSEQVLGYAVYVGDGDNEPYMRVATVDASTTSFNDTGSSRTAQRPPTTNTAQIAYSISVGGVQFAAQIWGLFIFAGHACKSILALYGSNSHGEVLRRIELELGGITDICDPTSPTWPYAGPYIDLTGSDGVTERFFGVFVRGPRWHDAITGGPTIAANICGIEEVGDGSGDTIDQAFYLWQHILSEFVLANDGEGYTSGAWAGLPTFADGVEMISSSSVQNAQTLSATVMGTTKGALAGACLTHPLTVSEFMRLFNQCFTSFSSINEHGQLSIDIVNTAADTTAGTPIREDIDDVLSVRAPQEDKSAVENRLQARWDYDADADAWRADYELFQNTASKDKHKRWAEREQYDLLLVRDAATARNSMNRRLGLFKKAPRLIPMTAGLSGLNLSIGDQVRVSGIEGYGASGYALRPALITRLSPRPDDGEVDLECWDMGGDGGVMGARFGTYDANVGQRTWGTGSSVTWGTSTSTPVWGA